MSAVSYEATDVAAFGTKPGIGKSAVHFRYYDKSEYSKLTKEQKTELHEWQSKGGAERGRSDAKTKKAKFEKAVAAAVEKKISEQAKASDEEKMAGDKLRSLVTSIIKETWGMTTSGRRATTIESKSILDIDSLPSLSSLRSSLSLSHVFVMDTKAWRGELSVMLMSSVLCGSPPGSHNSSSSGFDVMYPPVSMDETSIVSPSQDLSSFLAFLRMLLSEGEVEGGLESGRVGLSTLFAEGFGGGPYAFHCGLAHTASGLIGLPHFCVIGLLDLLVAVVAPMVVACLPEVVHPPGFLDDACDKRPEFLSGHLLLFAHLCLLADFLLNGSSHGLFELGLLGLGITPTPLSSSFALPFTKLCLLLLRELGVFAFIVIAKMYCRLAYPRLGSKSCNIGRFV